MNLLFERFRQGHLQAPPVPTPRLSDPKEKDRLRERHARVIRRLNEAEQQHQELPPNF